MLDRRDAARAALPANPLHLRTPASAGPTPGWMRGAAAPPGGGSETRPVRMLVAAASPTSPTSAGLHSGGRWPAPSSSPPGSSSSSPARSASSHSSAPSAEGGTQGPLAGARPLLSPVLPKPCGAGQGCRPPPCGCRDPSEKQAQARSRVGPPSPLAGSLLPAQGAPKTKRKLCTHLGLQSQDSVRERKTQRERWRRRRRARGRARGRDAAGGSGGHCGPPRSPGPESRGAGPGRGFGCMVPVGADAGRPAWLSWGLCKVNQTFCPPVRTGCWGSGAGTLGDGSEVPGISRRTPGSLTGPQRWRH